jgi:hypothetical protein
MFHDQEDSNELIDDDNYVDWNFDVLDDTHDTYDHNNGLRNSVGMITNSSDEIDSFYKQSSGLKRSTTFAYLRKISGDKGDEVDG